jgi:uncharacterized protein YceK
MKILFSLIVLVLSACASVVRPEPAASRAPPQAPGTLSITGDDLKQTGRMDLPDALRATSPIFH